MTQEQQEQQDQEDLLDLRETAGQRARRQQLEAVASQKRWERLVLKVKQVKTDKQVLEEQRVDKARQGRKDPVVRESELLSLLDQQELMVHTDNKEPWVEQVLSEQQETPSQIEQMEKTVLMVKQAVLELRELKVSIGYKDQQERLGEVILTAALTLLSLLALMGWMV